MLALATPADVQAPSVDHCVSVILVYGVAAAATSGLTLRVRGKHRSVTESCQLSWAFVELTQL